MKRFFCNPKPYGILTEKEDADYYFSAWNEMPDSTKHITIHPEDAVCRKQ